MADLIDEYDNQRTIESPIKLEWSQQRNERHQAKCLLNELNFSFKQQNVNLQERASSSRSGSTWDKDFYCRIQTSHKPLNKYLSIRTVCVIDTLKLVLKTESTVLRNGLPIRVIQKTTRLMITRHLNKLNLPSRDCYFGIEPQTGYMFIRMCTMLSVNQLQQLKTQPKSLVRLVHFASKVTTRRLAYCLPKLLFLVEQLDQNSENLQSVQNKQIRKAQEGELSTKHIEQEQLVCNLPFKFMVAEQLKQLRLAGRYEQQDFRHSIQQLKCRTDPKNQNFEQIKSIFDMSEKQLLNENFNDMLNQLLETRQQTFVNYLKLPTVRMANQLDNSCIFSQIYIMRPETVKWEVVGEGGFSVVLRGQIQFFYVAEDSNLEQLKMTPAKWLKKFVVVKMEKDPQKKKLLHERNILKVIGNMSCANVGKFYWSSQPEFADKLLMDYCAGRSLDVVIRLNQTTMSLLTRIFFCNQANQAVRFLNINRIYHLDIKPQNMLIFRNYVLRITDFGESYHPALCAPEYHPGYTLPYSAPQIFQPIIDFKPQLQIFSLGIMMHQVLLERFPWQVTRSSLYNLIQFYRGSYKLLNLNPPESCANLQNGSVVGLLQFAIQKCIDFRPSKRPIVQWIVIMLRESFDHLDRLF